MAWYSGLSRFFNSNEVQVRNLVFVGKVLTLYLQQWIRIIWIVGWFGISDPTQTHWNLWYHATLQAAQNLQLNSLHFFPFILTSFFSSIIYRFCNNLSLLCEEIFNDLVDYILDSVLTVSTKIQFFGTIILKTSATTRLEETPIRAAIIIELIEH